MTESVHQQSLEFFREEAKAARDQSLRTHYFLIDFENVQPVSLGQLQAEEVRVFVFVGARQSQISVDLAAALQPLGPRVEYVRITRNGANALDFHLAFFLGQLAERDPTALFHIVSQDTGFDPLIEYLKERQIAAERIAGIAKTKASSVAATETLSEQLARVVTGLRKLGDHRPRTVKSLANTIRALLGHQSSVQEVEVLLATLQAEGVVELHKNRLAYSLPTKHSERAG